MILRPAEPQELEQLCQVVDLAFKSSKLESKMIEHTFCEDAHFREGDLKVVAQDGQIVSVVMIIRRPFRIGSAIISGADIAPLATHPDYQNQGFGSALMTDGVQYMKNSGIDLAILWGHPQLYTRFGYTPAIMRTEIVINTRQSLPQIMDGFRCRPYSSSDLEQICEIYHANSALRTIADLRSPEPWDWKPLGEGVQFDVVLNETAKVCGYYVLGKDWGRPCAHEIGVTDHSAAQFIFKTLLERAREQKQEQLPCLVHPDHPFARYAFTQGSSQIVGNGGGAGMAQVLNLRTLLTKMQPEFERRLQRSELSETTRDLIIHSERDQLALRIKQGRVSINEDHQGAEHHLEIPLDGLNPLITGFQGISDLVEHLPEVKVTGGESARRLIDVLFPAGYPTGGSPPLVWE